MLTDLVLDTNVLVHAENPEEPRQAASIALITRLRSATTVACIDPGFSVNQAQNKSLIGAEYLKHLRAGSPGLALIAFLAANGRISAVSRDVDLKTKREIIRMVRNKRDRTFLFVTINSVDRTLASHNFKDMQKDKRKFIRTEYGVAIIEAVNCLNLL